MNQSTASAHKALGAVAALAATLGTVALSQYQELEGRLAGRGRAAAGRSMDDFQIVGPSFVVPGTTEDVVLPIVERASNKQAGQGFGIGMNPEFLREGNAITDFMNPDRIVLGGIDERDGWVYLGAAATAEDLRRSPIMQELIPDLRRFTDLISSQPIRWDS